MAMAMRVNTEAHILVFATNCDILQKRYPKGQFEFSMYTKFSAVLSVDTIASAIERFTKEGRNFFYYPFEFEHKITHI